MIISILYFSVRAITVRLHAQERIKLNCTQVPVFERELSFAPGVNSTSTSVVVTPTGSFHVVSDVTLGGIRKPIVSTVLDTSTSATHIRLNFGSNALVKHHIQLPNGDFILVGDIELSNNQQILVAMVNASNSGVV